MATLEGDELREKAIAANSVQFVRTLQEEGYQAPEIHAILTAIAKRLQATGQRIPGAGLYDLDRLASE